MAAPQSVKSYVKSLRIAAPRLAKDTARDGLQRIGTSLWSSAQTRRAELARRNELRNGATGQWFTDEERKLVLELADLIVPATEGSPGAKDVGIVERLGELVAGSPPRQRLYGRGLVAFDELARRVHGVAFADLQKDQQVELAKRIEQLEATGRGGPSAAHKLKSLLKILQYQRSGTFAAIELWRMSITDVTALFYTSPESWKWLGYDGPPMPRGYPDLNGPPQAERAGDGVRARTDPNGPGSV